MLVRLGIPLLLLGCAAAFALAPPVGARAAAERIEVLGAVAVPDRGVLVFDVRCRGRCVGRLAAVSELQGDATFARPVRLRPGRRERVELRLRRGGLARFELKDEVYGSLELRAAGRRGVWADFALGLRMSCRSGATLAADDGVRVLDLRPWGVYVCSLPRGRPLFVTSDSVDQVRVAGPFAAVADYGAWKCGSAQVRLVDIRARRVVRTRTSSTKYESFANSCVGTGSIAALVLSRTGAMAWIERPGDDGRVHVRALDADGTDRWLEQAPDVDLTSLTLAPDGASVSWTRGGVPRTAPLG